MQIPAVIDVAIGLVVLYLLLSTLSTLFCGGSKSFQNALRLELNVSLRQVHQIIIADAARSEHY